MMSQSIYIADDEKNIRDLIKGFLLNEGYSVSAFEDGDALLEAFLDKPSDMVILDIMMPGSDGLTICSQIRQKNNVPIIIVSARDSEIDRITGFSYGSDDYLVKPFSPLELVARVKAVFRRLNLEKKKKKTRRLHFGDIVLNVDTRTCTLQERTLDLTPTEFALMVYMFEHSERAISRDELLKNVWKFDFEVDTRAVDDVLKRLRRKIADSKVVIESVWGFGFKLTLEENTEEMNHETHKS